MFEDKEVQKDIKLKDSSRFGSVGEVSIDFASYAEATKLSSLSLPLINANSGAVLHVSIQRVQRTSDQRDIDGICDDGHHDRSLRLHFGNGDIEESSDTSSGLNTPCEREPKNAKLTHESSITKHKSSQWDCLNGSDPKVSTDDSSTSTLGETSEESSPEAMIQNLKVKVAALTRQTNVSE
ncbi:putative NT-type C2 domain-containing protein [Helianthus annuus]|nr:putative NT-type C2 domain-containing protein [Helianthus annuus]